MNKLIYVLVFVMVVSLGFVLANLEEENMCGLPSYENLEQNYDNPMGGTQGEDYQESISCGEECNNGCDDPPEGYCIEDICLQSVSKTCAYACDPLTNEYHSCGVKCPARCNDEFTWCKL